MWDFTWVLGLGIEVGLANLTGRRPEFHLVDSGDDGHDDE